ncbi:2-phospho-L-lactate guanylyltransferase [Georgenia deserti]|uniref:Phosphoenolpyruvate guanylyltransferase n=1 Tax=Georgenia deserti TaxID=2093781 RepID=A0ABW4L1S4_9MICO
MTGPAENGGPAGGRVIAVVPVRGGANGKSRLAPDLGAEERERLVGVLARHVVTTLLAVVDRVVVVTADLSSTRRAVGADVRLDVIEQSREGLNGAVADGCDFAFSGRAARVAVMHADLPLLDPTDVLALVTAEAPVVLAPDHAREGTNAIALDRGLAAWRFRFGQGSFAEHAAEAERHGVAPFVLQRPGLGVDLDTPGDWEALPGDARDALRRLIRSG